jgi:dTDP-4-dehydrorhamnose reductase
VKCLIIGSGGQLGRALQQTAPDGAELTAPSEAECNLTDPSHVRYWLSQTKPDLVVNAAAYTAVDAAESDAATAAQVNCDAVRSLAQATRNAGARLVHISTDFVFDGCSNRPYLPNDAPNPVNVYGRTKLDGEHAALEAASSALVVRTAWVYSESGRNFVHTMLRAMRERPEVRVVADQIGTPTYARNLAAAIWALTAGDAQGIYHFTDAGVASWYDFAVAIAEESLARGILERTPAIVPICTADYPTPARRPAYSVLDKTKTSLLLGNWGQHWREALRCMLNRLVRND